MEKAGPLELPTNTMLPWEDREWVPQPDGKEIHVVEWFPMCWVLFVTYAFRTVHQTQHVYMHRPDLRSTIPATVRTALRADAGYENRCEFNFDLYQGFSSGFEGCRNDFFTIGSAVLSLHTHLGRQRPPG